MPKTEEGWKQKLTPEQYAILREKGTEAPGSGALLHEKREGMYTCAACGAPLFPSDAKFDSGTGWPSFYKPAAEESVDAAPDNSLFMRRTEVVCSRCGGHLGHIFNDGPQPTGKRHCLNGVALDFRPA